MLVKHGNKSLGFFDKGMTNFDSDTEQRGDNTLTLKHFFLEERERERERETDRQTERNTDTQRGREVGRE